MMSRSGYTTMRAALYLPALRRDATHGSTLWTAAQGQCALLSTGVITAGMLIEMTMSVFGVHEAPAEIACGESLERDGCA